MTQAGGMDDQQQIAEVMATYIEGARSGRSAELRGIFHALATICGYVGPDLFAGPIQLFFDWHDDNGPAPGVHTLATWIDVQGSAASVRLDIDDWTGHRFTDYFTLVKVDGRWLILGKVFHLHAD